MKALANICLEPRFDNSLKIKKKMNVAAYEKNNASTVNGMYLRNARSVESS